MFNFATLAPTAVAAKNANLAADNEAALTGQVLGIEVTEPGLAARCSLGNIDPQHAGGNASRAAIEEAVSVELPPEGTTLVTVRADLDSIGAMAVLAMRADPDSGFRCAECGGTGWREDEFAGEQRPCEHCSGGVNHALSERVRRIATADKFARGGWRPATLPTRENPWPEGSELGAIAAAVMDHKVPLAARVETMEKWLLNGDEPDSYRASMEKERLDMIAALENGTIKSETRAGGKIAVVESTHRAATSVGYSLAPVVVALNPTFKQGSGDAYKKFTICAFEAKFADIKSALAELAQLEAGWGGSPTIGGSPQGVSSQLTIDQVVEVVESHLDGREDAEAGRVICEFLASQMTSESKKR